MASNFNGGVEPMRAIRDLINASEAVFGQDHGEETILQRARDGFTALRALHGDTRPGEAIAEAEMREPDFALIQLLAGALHTVSRLLPNGEKHVINFTGAYSYLGSPPIAEILDMAKAALEGVARAAFPRSVMN